MVLEFGVESLSPYKALLEADYFNAKIFGRIVIKRSRPSVKRFDKISRDPCSCRLAKHCIHVAEAINGSHVAYFGLLHRVQGVSMLM